MTSNLPLITSAASLNVCPELIASFVASEKRIEKLKLNMRRNLLKLDDKLLIFTGHEITRQNTLQRITYRKRYIENKTSIQTIKIYRRLIIRKKQILKRLIDPSNLNTYNRVLIVRNNRLIIRDLRRERFDKKQKRRRLRCTLDRRRSDQEVANYLDRENNRNRTIAYFKNR